MDGLEQQQYNHMDTEELQDLLVTIRHNIAKKIRHLAGDFRALTVLQNKQEKVQARLEELGGAIGSIKSKTGEWKEEEIEDEENE